MKTSASALITLAFILPGVTSAARHYATVSPAHAPYQDSSSIACDYDSNLVYTPNIVMQSYSHGDAKKRLCAKLSVSIDGIDYPVILSQATRDYGVSCQYHSPNALVVQIERSDSPDYTYTSLCQYGLVNHGGIQRRLMMDPVRKIQEGELCAPDEVLAGILGYDEVQYFPELSCGKLFLEH